ncbi:MAG: NB-ARC domain-containing protein [Synechococcales bacterium]|nr:NB-ARC domain-containing protein [Synechococcales bacterium]
MLTVRASELGLQQIDQARRKKGWLKQSERWCQTACTSRATLKRFWRREAIEQGTFIALCTAVGITDWATIAADPEPLGKLHLCLKEMPDVSVFFGRETVLAQLTTWVTESRLIVVWGLGGIGKTALLAEWVESLLQSENGSLGFDAIFWRSLPSQPSLTQLTESLANSLEKPLQKPGLTELLDLLQNQRILLILDNWEAIVGTEFAGKTKTEFEDFSLLLKKLGQHRSQSCVVISSSEKPTELALLEGTNSTVKSYKLEGLGKDAIALLQHRQLKPELEALHTLNQLYRGHPLALNMISSLIQEGCQGSARTFLEMNTIVVHQLDTVFAERIRNLSEPEQHILHQLVKTGKLMTHPDLQMRLPTLSSSQLLEALISLERRCLLETFSDSDRTAFTISPALRKYLRQTLFPK